MHPTIEEFEGPRLVRKEEIVDSVKLFQLCFGGPPIENEAEILASYIVPKRGGAYAFLHKGKPVSQLIIFHDQIKMYDGTVRAGSVGGVCTHPDFRGRGLASRLLEHCAEQLKKEGATLMLISGARGVYTRLGNVFHGKFVYFSIQPREEGHSRRNGLVIRKASNADAMLCSRLYQAEPVHFARRKSNFAAALEHPMGNTYLHAESWIIERAGQPLAYLFLGIPYNQAESSGIRHVSEYAGSRSALVEAIRQIIARSNLQKVDWPVAWQDLELIQLLQDKGYECAEAPLDGHTLRILNLPKVMKDLRPILEGCLDAKLLRGLRFEQNGPLLGGTGADRYAMIRGRERLELDGAAMTYLVMGNADVQAEKIYAPGSLKEVISSLFPLPSFMPGLNYH